MAMGWDNDYLHQFVVDGRYFGQRYGFMGMEDVGDESKIRLREIAPAERRRFTDEYDLGDG